MTAQPTLASSLWAAEQSDQSEYLPSKRRKLSTGCDPINKSLSGGFDYGSISCLSSEAESGSKELSHSLIAKHLLASNGAEATVIDTTNSFDVRGLHKRLVLLLQGNASQDDAKGEAIRVLERVRIMKAFDFVGMRECVAELRDALENRKQTGQALRPRSEQPESPEPRGTVGDSEDEEDDMLDEPPPPEKPEPAVHSAEDERSSDPPCNLLVIDNITYATAPMLKNNHVQGQALLATFMRSLAHLTRTYDLCLVLQNSAVTHQTNAATDPTPSIFSSCSLRPALGRSFAYMLDMHLLLHKIPLSGADAKSIHAAHSSIPRPSGSMASVLEVMQDRHGDRVGHWAAFHPDAEGNLAPIS